VRLLYRGTLRLLLVLLHDFPEFLCDHHFNLCDTIPPNCIQMRNLAGGCLQATTRSTLTFLTLPRTSVRELNVSHSLILRFFDRFFDSPVF
jgi:hypothetical protein